MIMKRTRLFSSLLITIFMCMAFSCQDEEPLPEPIPPVVEPEDPEDPEKPEEKIFLELNPALMSIQQGSRGIIEAFQAGHALGIFADTAGVHVAENTDYTFDGKEWNSRNKVPVKGDMDIIAYFPQMQEVQEYTRIPIHVEDQNDILYGTTKVTEDFPTADLNMNHALTLIRILVKKNDYQGEGNVSHITFKGISCTGSLDASSGEITGEGANGSFKAGGNYRLNDADPVSVDAILLPVTTPAGISVSFGIDGKEFTYEFPSQHEWKPGMMYTYTLNMKGDYNMPVDMEDVPIDVEYWSQFGKTDQIVLRDCGDDLFTVRPNYTKYGYDCYQNEGKVFGVFYSSFCDYKFEGKLRFVFMQGNKIVEKFQPVDIDLPSGQWDGKPIQCYVTSTPGIYQLVPLFQKEGETTWFKAFSYEQNSSDEEWMYEVKQPAPNNLPALRMMEVEGKGFTSTLAYRVPDDKSWNLVYTISNKGGGTLKGEIKAVWEREFKQKSNSYRPSHRKAGAVNDTEYADEIGRISVDIAAGSHFWKGIMSCKFSTKRPEGTHNGVGYCTPSVHLYWKAEGSNEWILMRQDADYLFNRSYTGNYIWDETTNYVAIIPESW